MATNEFDKFTIEQLVKDTGRFDNSNIDYGIIGNNAISFRARLKDGMRCFIKVPNPVTRKNEVENFYNYYNSLPDITHIVRVADRKPLDLGDLKAIVMQEADDSLDRYLARISGPLNENKAIGLITHLALGIEQLHNSGIIHRDIKPSNMLLYGSDWTVSDFGTARIGEGTTTVFEGTRGYMAYEQMQLYGAGKKLRFTVQTDIYGLGVIFYQLLTDSHPNPFSHLQAHASNDELYDFTMSQIENMPVTQKTKSMLRMLLGKENVGAPGQSHLDERFRYKSVGFFKDHLRGKQPDQRFNPDSQVYKEFLDASNRFVQAQKSASADTSGPWGTIGYKAIDQVVSSYYAVLPLTEKREVQAGLRSSEMSVSFREIFNGMIDRQRARIEPYIKKVENIYSQRPLAAEEVRTLLRPLYEICFLWGPPMTWRRTGGREGKERYTLQETLARQTFYHDKLRAGWGAGCLKDQL